MDLRVEKEYIKAELDKVEEIHLVEAIKNMLAYGKAIEGDSLISQEDARAYFARKNE